MLGWKSPNFVYANAIDQRMRLLLRNYKLSDDIAFRFSNQGWDQWPLTAAKFAGWLASEDTPGEVINLFMDYETFGEHQTADTGIFEFMRSLPAALLATNELEFATVSEAAAKYQPVSVLHCPHTMSWADEERDVTAWLGNELQNEAFSKLYALKDKIADGVCFSDICFPLTPCARQKIAVGFIGRTLIMFRADIFYTYLFYIILKNKNFARKIPYKFIIFVKIR